MLRMSPLFSKTIILWILCIGVISESVAEKNETLSDFPNQHIVVDLLDDPDNMSSPSYAPIEMSTHKHLDALRFDNPERIIAVRQEAVPEVLRLLRVREYKRNFLFSFTLVQAVGNSGKLLMVSAKPNFRFGIQSDGRRKEIRVQYKTETWFHYEVFHFNLADGKLHNVVLSVIGKKISLFVDCIRLYRRVCPRIALPSMTRWYALYIGNRNNLFDFLDGALYEVKFVTPAKGFVLQCSNLEEDNSTCASSAAIEHKMKMVSKREKRVIMRLGNAKAKLLKNEQSSCEKNCIDNFPHRLAGEVWKTDKCTTCRCQNGAVECKKEKCLKVNCRYPFYRENKCCPFYCSDSECLYASRQYDHGEEFMPRKCIRCKCWKGNVACQKQYIERDCPKLNCAKDKRIAIEGECCPVCESAGDRVVCVNLAKGKECHCKDGFQRKGFSCADINECLTDDWSKGHRCEFNAACVNTPGSYHCECKKGYSRLDNYATCKDIDECLTSDEPKRHTCDENEICVNTLGAYRCECMEGYQRIDNNKCADIDECLTSDEHKRHTCDESEICVNTLGAYHCECKEGYQLINDSNCADIDECLASDEPKRHTCDESEVCVNTLGAYRCDCMEGYQRIGDNKCVGPTGKELGIFSLTVEDLKLIESSPIKQEIKELILTCSSLEMQKTIQHDCETGNIVGCNETSGSVDHLYFCTRTYVCEDVNRYSTNTTMKCLLLCGLLNFGSLRPLSEFWIKNSLVTSRSNLTKQYIGQETNKSIVGVGQDRLAVQAYLFFHDLERMTTASITTMVDNCPGELAGPPYNRSRIGNIVGYRTCFHMTNPVHCKAQGKEWKWIPHRIHLDFADHDYCSKDVTNRVWPPIDRRKQMYCFLNCWYLDTVINDPPNKDYHNGGHYDVILTAKSGNIIHTTNLIDARFRVVWNEVHTFVLGAWKHFQSGDIRIRITSRKCLAAKPKLCELEDQNEVDPKMLVPASLCTIRSKFDPDVENVLGTLPDGFSQECAVRIGCDYSKSEIKPWGRPIWCQHVDWIFNKSVEWLKHGADSDLDTYMVLHFKGTDSTKQSPHQYVRLIKEKVQPLRTMKTVFHESMMKFSYPGVWFSIYFVFKDCQNEIKGSPSIEAPYNEDCTGPGLHHAPWTVFYYRTMKARFSQHCSEQGRHNATQTNVKTTCQFIRNETIEQVCNKFIWLTYVLEDNAVRYPNAGPYKVTIEVKVQDGKFYTHVIPQVGPKAAIVYIKSFLADHDITKLAVVSLTVNRDEPKPS